MAHGLKAFDIVNTYSDMGHHRTGTKTDAAAIDWLAGLLRNAGAEVTCPPFPYSHYDAAATITINGQCIEAMALYYAYTGTATIRPAFGEVNGHDAEDNIASTIITAVAQARQLGHDGLISPRTAPMIRFAGSTDKAMMCWISR